MCSQAPISAVITTETVPSCVSPPPRPPEPACALPDTACARGNSLVRVSSIHAQFLDLAQFGFKNWWKWKKHGVLFVFLFFSVGVGSFLLYSVHEGIRGIPLDPLDKSDALVPVSGTSLAVGIDFHAGKTFVQQRPWVWNIRFIYLCQPLGMCYCIKVKERSVQSTSNLFNLFWQTMTQSTGWTWAWAPSAGLREIRPGEKMLSPTALAGWRASQSTGLQV